MVMSQPDPAVAREACGACGAPCLPAVDEHGHALLLDPLYRTYALHAPTRQAMRSTTYVAHSAVCRGPREGDDYPAPTGVQPRYMPGTAVQLRDPVTRQWRTDAYTVITATVTLLISPHAPPWSYGVQPVLKRGHWAADRPQCPVREDDLRVWEEREQIDTSTNP